MKLTRIVALTIISGTIALAVADTALQAQTLRAVRPPAEFPPASFRGKQFVDSRGCVYIRAGIDGNVHAIASNCVDTSPRPLPGPLRVPPKAPRQK